MSKKQTTEVTKNINILNMNWNGSYNKLNLSVGAKKGKESKKF